MINKKILFFTDLEGTILRDSDGDFYELDFEDLISELSRMGTLTDATVDIRLVSPIGFKRMNKIVDKMDTSIARYFRREKLVSNVKLVEAAASPYDMHSEDIVSSRKISRKIIPLPNARHSSDIAREAKRKYLKYVFEACKGDIALSIYAGNDRNDIDAMQYLKRKQNGFLICPQNSITELLNISDFVSNDPDILGVIDGISKINEKIEIRTRKTKQMLETDNERV